MLGPMCDDEESGWGPWVLSSAIVAAVGGAFQVWKAHIHRDAAIRVAKIDRKTAREAGSVRIEEDE